MTAPDLAIRAETAADFPAIRAVVTAAFESDAEADLVDLIRASPQYLPAMALVAELKGEVVGHVMISGATLRADGGDRSVVMLSPLAVAPAHQGAGIGSALVRAVCAIADETGEPMVVLEGSPAYYRRFGFEPSYEYGIELPLPDWAPRPAGQVLRLAAWNRPPGGVVVYPPAFAAVEDSGP